MDIQSTALNAIFVLFPVHIPGMVAPLKPDDLAHGGIPKSLYDGQSQGLECLVDPWEELKLRSWTMAADDRVDLYVNDDPTPLTGKTVAPGEEQLRVRLYMPHGRLRNGVNRVYYKVTRVSGNSENSRDLNVLYYLRSPGEPAPQGLDLGIPVDVIKDGVSAARAAQGVEFGFTYSNRRAYDRIRFQIGDEWIEWEVPDPLAPVTKTLFTDTFQQVGDNLNLQLNFLAFDQLGNYNQSPTKQIDVHLGRTELEMAILREILTENTDDPKTVDLAKLNGGPLWALIHLIGTIWNAGDEIHLTFTAMLNGSQVAFHEATLPITQVPGQVSLGIPNDKIIANSVVTVTYEQKRGGKVIATSAPATAQVIGEDSELVVDVSPMTLSGHNLSIKGSGLDWGARNYDPPGSATTRSVSGGNGTYTWRSSNDEIASVDAAGTVRSEGNGTAIITVSDGTGKSKSFTVLTSNVTRVRVNFNKLNHPQIRSWIASIGGTMLYPNQLVSTFQMINNKYYVKGNWCTGEHMVVPETPYLLRCIIASSSVFTWNGIVTYGEQSICYLLP